VHSGAAIGHVLLALVLSYVIGYERQVRGARAGDRTFALVGVGAAIAGILATHGQPAILSGVLSGIGFLGAGLLLRPTANVVTGLSSAAAIFATAAIGAAIGQGYLLLGSVSALTLLLLLEIPLVPGLRLLDASRMAHHFRDDPSHAKDPNA
jgi:putative Mg2+ transporter-C (MgtC) family protein